MEKRQSRSYWDQNEASCRCAKKKNHQSTRIKKGGFGSGFLLHNKWVVGAPRSWTRDGCQCFSYCSDYSALAVVRAALAANEIDYAGDTPAAIVTGIADPGYNAHL